MKRIKHTLSMAIGFLLVGCTSTQLTSPPLSNITIPEHWQGLQSVKAVQIEAGWWQQFNNQTLVQLLTQARQHNQNWQAALHRIEQARATLSSTKSVYWPNVSLSTTASANQQAQNQQTKTTHSHTMNIQLSYELDLFGQSAANTQAARANVLASQYAANSVYMVLETDVAVTYFELCLLAERLKLTERNNELLRELLTRIEQKKIIGMASELEVAQQQQLLATARADYEGLKARLAAARSALAILTGTVPQYFEVTFTPLNTLAAPIPNARQPATLLTRRPDILRAEANLLAAHANVTAARAAFFPNITLSASNAFSGWMSVGSVVTRSLVAQLSATLFDGGKRKAGLATAKARQQELIAVYRQTVLQALKEGEDALQNLDTQQKKQIQLQRALVEAQKVFQLSEKRYELGSIDYMTLLEAQRTRISSEVAVLQSQYDNLIAIITLYKALGGSPAVAP